MRRRSNVTGEIVSLHNLQTQLRDVKLRFALLAAARQEDDAIAARFSAMAPNAPERAEEQAFHARTMDKVLHAIRTEERRSHRARQVQGMQAAIRFAAAVLLLSFLGLGTAMAFSPALRVTVMRLLYSVTPQYTRISMVEDKAASFDVPKEWGGRYYPAFIPDGYVFSEVFGTKSIRNAIFTADGGRTMRFTENDGKIRMNVDTQGFKMQDIEIHGQPALLALTDGYSKIVWSEADRYFIVDISEDAETAIRVAQSVIIIK